MRSLDLTLPIQQIWAFIETYCSAVARVNSNYAQNKCFNLTSECVNGIENVITVLKVNSFVFFLVWKFSHFSYSFRIPLLLLHCVHVELLLLLSSMHNRLFVFLFVRLKTSLNLTVCNVNIIMPFGGQTNKNCMTQMHWSVQNSLLWKSSHFDEHNRVKVRHLFRQSKRCWNAERGKLQIYEWIDVIVNTLAATMNAFLG